MSNSNFSNNPGQEITEVVLTMKDLISEIDREAEEMEEGSA